MDFFGLFWNILDVAFFYKQGYKQKDYLKSFSMFRVVKLRLIFFILFLFRLLLIEKYEGLFSLFRITEID